MTTPPTNPEATGMTVERLTHLADVARGLDDPHDIGYYECCALASQALAQARQIEELNVTLSALRAELKGK